MNRRTFAGIVFFCAAGGLLFWLLRGTDEAHSGRVHAAKTPAASPRSDSALKKGDQWPEFGTPEFQRMALERGQKWLDLRGRDAASLVAAWDLTGEASMLDEAAEKFPNDPRVCVAMIIRLGSTVDALPWVERLIAAEPGNPAGLYWKAQILAGSKKPEEAIETLRAATGTKGKPDTHLRDRMVTVREAALASGATVKEAAIVALSAPLSRHGALPPVAGRIGRLLHEEIEAAKAAGDADRVADIASLGAASGEHLGLTDAPTFMNDLVRMSMLRAMLKELDPETEFGADGKTAATRLSEVEAEWTETTKGWKPTDPADAWPNNLNKLTEAQVSEYTDRFILHGERVAQRWLDSLTTEQKGNK